MNPGTMPSLAIAKIVDNRDKEGLGRVRVTFPWLEQSMQTEWISVSQPHAGKDRGIFWMPEVDDEVLVGFLHGDINKPVVIGAMWNDVHKPPARDPRHRMIRSKNGHTIHFVDSTVTNGDKGALIIRDGHGSSLAMSNGYVVLSTKGTLVLEADAVQLRGKGWKRTITPNSNAV
jgi:phage baseplate assembly protein V